MKGDESAPSPLWGVKYSLPKRQGRMWQGPETVGSRQYYKFRIGKGMGRTIASLGSRGREEREARGGGRSIFQKFIG